MSERRQTEPLVLAEHGALSEDRLDDPRLFGAVQEYLAALEAGQRLERAAFLEERRDIADALVECLDAVDAVQQARSAFRPLNHPLHAGADPHSLVASTLGDFRIVREIGRGGMGVVYEAIQVSLGRRVALKVLPFAAALDATQLQRFKNEAQAAAHLSHAHIVPVHAVGSDRGLHYYAMQLIEGQTLADVIDELREAGAGSGRNGAQRPETGTPSGVSRAAPLESGSLSLSARGREFYRTAALLGLQAAQALEHAHQLGVLHRDIKPGNLLIDGGGKLWITDFGLAQFSKGQDLTRTGDLVGTLRYMSPEQARGPHVNLDQRTDVYSLGIVLYELMTRQPAFHGADHAGLLHQLIFDEPRAPRKIDPTIPVDLETILLKATAKNLRDRYASAAALAEDLQRFLSDQPVLARRPAIADRVRKWTRRHPELTAACFLLLALLSAGLVISNWLIAREQEKTRLAYDRERERAEEARRERVEAERRFRQARHVVDSFLQIADEELTDKPFLHGLRRRLLQAALGTYQDFIDERRDDSKLLAELQQSRSRMERLLTGIAVLEMQGQVRHLRNRAVQDDLQLSTPQQIQLKHAFERLDDQRGELFRDFLRLLPEQREQRLLEYAGRQKSAVGQVLSEAQRHRLRQLSIQSHGPHAFGDPEVVKELRLTPQQQDQIRAIEAESMVRLSAPVQEDGRWPPPPPEVRDRDTLKRIVEVLTPAQRQIWDQMRGKPFQGHLGPW